MSKQETYIKLTQNFHKMYRISQSDGFMAVELKAHPGWYQVVSDRGSLLGIFTLDVRLIGSLAKKANSFNQIPSRFKDIMCVFAYKQRQTLLKKQAELRRHFVSCI